MTKAFGKGSVAQRTIPAENGVQYRLWRLRQNLRINEAR